MTLNARSRSALSASGSDSLFAEVFPVRQEAIPPLIPYRLVMSEGDSAARRIGARTADLLRQVFGGFWSWIGGHLLNDAPLSPADLATFVEDARAAYPRVFAALQAIEPDGGWQPTPAQIADWLARGPIAALEPRILDALRSAMFTIKNARIAREYRIRTWTIDDAPALSVSVISRLLYEPDLTAYLAAQSDPTAIVGLWAADKLTGMQGEIVKLVGQLREQRARLLDMTSNPAMRDLIAAAPDDGWVVRVASGIRDYDYAVDALDLVIRPDDISQFAINRTLLDRALHLKPAAHAQMVRLVSDVLKSAGLIDRAYNNRPDGAPHLFRAFSPTLQVRWGDGRARAFSATKAGADFAEHSAALPSPALAARPLRVALIDAAPEGAKDFLEALRRATERMAGVPLEVARVRDMRVISQTNIDSAVRLLAKENADVLIIALPDDTDSGDDLPDDDTVSERYARQQTIGRGLPTLIVPESVMQNPDAMPHIVMGLIARAGSAPYLAAEPLPFADHVIGLSLFYQDKRDGEHVTGIARIYTSEGRLVAHRVNSAAVGKGEGVPEALLATLLPRQILRGGRAVLHIDGRLPRDAGLAIGRWEDALDATFTTVEIIRAGAPRLYALRGGTIAPPERGSAFRLNAHEAFVITADSSVQPLHIRTEAPLSIEEAIESVMRFALLHYGAIRPPRLPVTLYQMETIAAGIARGIFPAQIEGSFPYWL